MDDLTDIHATARAWFMAKIGNGATPEEVVGGPFDGLRYFPVVIDENEPTQWLTEVGLFMPPDEPRENIG